MKITAGKRDEILKRKAAYDAELADYVAYEEEADSKYREAEYAVTDPIEKQISAALGTYSALQFDVRVNRASPFGLHRGVAVHISCNNGNKFADDVALAWSYDVSLDINGDVIRKSSSWSGLSATTPAQMKSLRQTVSALEYLNDLDWPSIIDVQMPKFEDYYDKDRRRPAYEDWDTQLAQADMEELIGQNKAIKVRSWGESCLYRGGDYVYIKILAETPTQYKVETAPAGWNDRMSDDQVREFFADGSIYEQRVKKANIHPAQPLKIIDLD